MKKYLYYLKYPTFAFLFLCGINFNIIFKYLTDFSPKATAYESQQIVYAKIEDNCKLYKSNDMSDEIGGCYFYLPSTYFVSIINCINDDIYQVQYSNFVGYVFAKLISKVSFTPIAPELQNISFSIAPNAGTQIWSQPSDSKGNKLATIPSGTANIEYIASSPGDIPIGGNVNLWYYARYTPSSNSTKVYEGYIYSEETTNLTNIPNNLEVEIEEKNSNLDSSISVETPLRIVMIVLICTPFLILIISSIIKATRNIKERKKIKSQTQSSVAQPANTSYVKKRKISKHSDTFEPVETIEVSFPQYDYIDDDDLL